MNTSKAVAHLPLTKLGKHGSKRAIRIEASKGDQDFGVFSVSKSGIMHTSADGRRRKRRGWESLVKYFSKGKPLS